uniref:3-ketoacyl-CoA synthase n=1 Tax=Rhizophora mucronata TaxID=61149 RepID=A0A2P2NGQ1_RHIMU
MQKCSKACLKSGIYGFHWRLKIFRPMRVNRKRSCSDAGRTKGPIVVMLDFKASPAIAIKSFDKFIPTLLSLSSSSKTQR